MSSRCRRVLSLLVASLPPLACFLLLTRLASCLLVRPYHAASCREAVPGCCRRQQPCSPQLRRRSATTTPVCLRGESRALPGACAAPLSQAHKSATALRSSELHASSQLAPCRSVSVDTHACGRTGCCGSLARRGARLDTQCRVSSDGLSPMSSRRHDGLAVSENAHGAGTGSRETGASASNRG